MPILLQKRLLSRIIGEEKVEDWSTLMVSEPFVLKGSDPLRYAAGQPMGAYSSWATMSLTHHLIVQIASIRASCPYWSYCILGDDIVIWDSRLAEEYRTLLLHLDMPISDQKTHVSKHVFEFCKRWYFNGKEVTGFSVSGLWEVRNSYSLLHNFLQTQAEHGWVLVGERANHPIKSLYKAIGRPHHGERVQKLYTVFSFLANARVTGTFKGVCEHISKVFRWPTCSASEETENFFFLKIKWDQLEKDLASCMSNKLDYVKYIDSVVSKTSKLWVGRPFNIYSSERIPIIIVSEFMEYELNELISVITSDHLTTEQWFMLLRHESAARYRISKEVYGLSRHKLVSRDLSRLTKSMISMVRNHILSDSKYPLLIV
jgi:hypothetical protein